MDIPTPNLCVLSALVAVKKSFTLVSYGICRTKTLRVLSGKSFSQSLNHHFEAHPVNIHDSNVRVS